MRKYNSKMKRTILIIGILFIIFIVIFSWFLKKAHDVAKTAYDLEAGSVLFDTDYNKITTSTTSTIKLKWAGDYYLKYQDNYNNLGKHSVVYNTTNGNINLYGKFYDILMNGDVKVRKNETKIKSSVNSKFYKMADREYLIVDRTIESSDSTFVTSNYLIIKLDKSGNATLLNDKVSLKTITPMVLKTSSYTFDIAREKIDFGKGEIDLTKIIGSTNLYDEDTYDLNASNTTSSEDKKSNKKSNSSSSGSNTDSESSTNSTGNSTNNSGTNNTNSNNTSTNNNSNINSGGSTTTQTSTYNNNYNSGISDQAVEEIKKATRNTSVIRVNPSINNITVDYVIYDPDNEYKSVYVEVENTETNKTNTVFLSKTDTKVIINELTPNVYYNLTFKYTYSDSGETKEYTFDEFGTRTSIPEINLSVVKVVDNKLYYKITFDNNYTIIGGTINLLVNGQQSLMSSISALGSVSSISGNDCYFDLDMIDIKKGDVITLRLARLNFNTYSINPKLSYKFKY